MSYFNLQAFVVVAVVPVDLVADTNWLDHKLQFVEPLRLAVPTAA